MSSWGQNFNLFNTLVYEQILVKLMTFPSVSPLFRPLSYDETFVSWWMVSSRMTMLLSIGHDVSEWFDEYENDVNLMLWPKDVWITCQCLILCVITMHFLLCGETACHLMHKRYREKNVRWRSMNRTKVTWLLLPWRRRSLDLFLSCTSKTHKTTAWNDTRKA